MIILGAFRIGKWSLSIKNELEKPTCNFGGQLWSFRLSRTFMDFCGSIWSLVVKKYVWRRVSDWDLAVKFY